MKIKYWRIDYPDENGNNITEILSENDIITDYWDYWYGKMCDKFGEEYVNLKYSKQDCIDDWVAIHWAIEAK